MQRLRWLAVVLCLSACDAGSAALAKREIPAHMCSVMTWNIRNANHDHNDNAWSHRKSLAMKVIGAYQPDLLALQEAVAPQILDIKARFPYYKDVSNPNMGEHVTLFYDSNKLKCLEHGKFWFSSTPDRPSKDWGALYPRFCQWALLEHLVLNIRFYAFNLHLSHVSEQARQKSVTLLIKKIKAIAKTEPIVILGDFNATIVSQAMLPLAGACDFSWVTQSLASSMNTSTYNGFSEETLANNPRQIDFVFYTHKYWAVKTSEIIDFRVNGRFPSDHFPVYGEFEYQREAQ